MSDARRWRTLVVDDEPPARQLLSGWVAATPSLVLAGACADGEEAVASIASDEIDVVLLDIQMPGLTGFDVIARVGVERMPLTIFVTAYDAHALEAFEAHAFGYLLKPVERARFDAAIARAVRRLSADAASDAHEMLPRQLQTLVDQLGITRAGIERLPLRTVGPMGRVVMVATREIDRVESEGNHLHVHVGGESHVTRQPLAELEARLPADRFARLNRSTVVNLDRVREVQPWFRGNYVVILTDGTRVVTGKTYRERVRELFGI